MHNNCFHRSRRGKPAWGHDEREMERVRNIAVFSPPIKLFVKPFTTGYAVYLLKINTLLSVWKLVATQDRPINYSVLCAIARLLKVEPYLYLFPINNYLLPCLHSPSEIDAPFPQCLSKPLLFFLRKLVEKMKRIGHSQDDNISTGRRKGTSSNKSLRTVPLNRYNGAAKKAPGRLTCWYECTITCL